MGGGPHGCVCASGRGRQGGKQAWKVGKVIKRTRPCIWRVRSRHVLPSLLCTRTHPCPPPPLLRQVAEYVSQLRRVGKGLGVYEFDKKLAAVVEEEAA